MTQGALMWSWRSAAWRVNVPQRGAVNRGANAGENREKISTIVSTRSLCPVANWSWTKSIAQVSLDRFAGLRSSRALALTRRLGVLLRNCRPNSRQTRRVFFWPWRRPSRRSST